MKKIKWLVAFLIVANLLLGVIGCKDPEIHIHTYSEAWTSDANGHWHEATCEHTTEVSGKAAHSFGDWKVTQEPTEEAEGSREKSCTVCEYTVPEVIEKLAHTHKFATDWTSDETNHWHASTCGHDVIEGKAEHSFGEYVSNNDATTEADGTKTRECSVCGYKDTVTDEGSKIHVHTFAEEWTSDSSGHWHAATCEHTTEVRGKAKHTFGDWTTTKEATEEEVGSKERVCSVCNYKETAEIEKLAHTHKFSSDWTYDGTHHWYAATCEHTTEVSDKAEHTFGNWTTTKAATEEAEGTKERSCTVCGYTATEVISKLDHTHKFATDWTKDATHHWKAATCEHTDEKSEKAVHVFGNWTVTKAATEEAEGTKERSCTVCGYTATEAIEKLAHTHKFAEEWTSNSSGHWHKATCGHDVTDSKAEHTFGIWEVVTDPTTTTEGTSKRICSICNFEETKPIIAIPEDFVLIPAGTFQMGSNAGFSDNKPVHQVTITKSFYMGKYEVTQAEYEKYCSYGSSSPSSSYGDGDNYPAYYVSWYDALVYCNKRSMAEGLSPCYSISGNTDPSKWGTVPISNNRTWNAVVCDWNANGYRLPTEAEWEYAARAGDNTVSSLTYAGTNSSSKLGEYAWYYDNSSDKTHAVGTKRANAFGLYDMSGNVWEWCWNWFASSYNTGTEGGSDPTGASSGGGRVRRGGGWNYDSDGCAVSYRYYYDLYVRNGCLGFRVVRASSN